MIPFWIVVAGFFASRPGLADDGGVDESKTGTPFVISVHVATDNSTDTNKRIQTFLNAANVHFRAAGISFEVDEQEVLPQSFAVLETQRERHLLKKYFVQNTVNVFLLDEILDPTPSAATKKAAAWQGRKPSGRLAGAVIEYKKKQPGIYIILSRQSDPLTLTHELGHLFGCPHSKDPKNIMSYGAAREHFNEKQLQTFLRKAKRYRKQRILRSRAAD